MQVRTSASTRAAGTPLSHAWCRRSAGAVQVQARCRRGAGEAAFVSRASHLRLLRVADEERLGARLERRQADRRRDHRDAAPTRNAHA